MQHDMTRRTGFGRTRIAGAALAASVLAGVVGITPAAAYHLGLEHGDPHATSSGSTVFFNNQPNQGFNQQPFSTRQQFNRRGPSCSSFGPGTLFGGALGGFAGSQIGSGSGRLAATAAGTFLGATLGSRTFCR